MNPALLLAAVLREPVRVESLTGPEWTALFAVARAEQLIGTLAHRIDGLAMPDAAARLVRDAIASAEQGRTAALWEAEMARRALAGLDMPVVLLKGTAYAAAGLSPSQGRAIGDLDILVPRERIEEAETALLAAGWEWVKPDPYDDAYYRQWMHELPPLIHRDRDKMIDVHHTILPLTARITPDAAGLISASIMLESGLPVWEHRHADSDMPARGMCILRPEDMVIHAVAHLIADGDLAGGMRNLWDIDRLVREFSERDEDFCLNVYEEAWPHGLLPAVVRAFRLAAALYGTPVKGYTSPIRVSLVSQRSDALFVRRLTARDGWGRSTRKFTQLGFYIRSHWLRMPPLMLARHLWTKWRKGYRPA
ncbi:nucleotidyltransferase family protein [Sphingomonas sp. JC676]|uniref:nucleotidyltransferase domain-containing protein n=1 Tax=Sphingomonas sp. JC676 TaxID=2768065 RepID=UPI00165840A4|nr:nucleotidyltransferase family protein [Sphingomonas sp. JC676]MBC9030901.1 nucleotidyltransferase family protein [Sphingomonas sp. JC676]